MSRFLGLTRDLLLLLAGALFVAGAAGALWGFGFIGPGRRGEPTPLGVMGIATMTICLVLGTLATRAPRLPPRRGLAPGKRERVERPRRTPSASEDVVLAEWTLAPDEWRAYNGQAADDIRYNARWNALTWGLIGVVVPWLVWVRWELSAAGGALLALIAFVWTRTAAHRRRTRFPRRGAGVVIRHGAVEIDGRRRVLQGDRMWLARARLRDDLPLAVLELTRRSETTGNDGHVSTTDDLIHVPIPQGREAEARKVARELTRKSLKEGWG